MASEDGQSDSDKGGWRLFAPWRRKPRDTAAADSADKAAGTEGDADAGSTPQHAVMTGPAATEVAPAAAGLAEAPPAIAEAPSEISVTAEPVRPRRFGGLFQRALARTRTGLSNLFLGRKAIDDALFEELETLLLLTDVGVETSSAIISTLTERVKRNQLKDSDALRAELRNVLKDILTPCEQPLEIGAGRPYVILVVGVNGVGKTTTIGKLARSFQRQGLSVMLAAGDTFRAAAVEQIQAWGQRNQVTVIAQHTGADSASVIFDAMQAARARGIDVLIADTAGRLHTKSNLMTELEKIQRVMARQDPSTPQEVLLVLDAGTGQNAIVQARQFHDAVGVSGLVLTKLDGTAKGGVIFALCQQFGIPIRYVGLGEGLDDLAPFSAEAFVDALLGGADGA